MCMSQGFSTVFKAEQRLSARMQSYDRQATRLRLRGTGPSDQQSTKSRLTSYFLLEIQKTDFVLRALISNPKSYIRHCTSTEQSASARLRGFVVSNDETDVTPTIK